MSGLTYYLNANSCNGHVSFFDRKTKDFKKIIVLKNISSSHKKELFLKVRKLLDSRGISCDTILRCATSDETDALIVDSMSLAIADENLFCKKWQLYADVVDFSGVNEFDFDFHKKITCVKKSISALTDKMLMHLDHAKQIHDMWEKIYVSNMDFDKVDAVSDELAKKLFMGICRRHCEKPPLSAEAFFGTLLARGSVNYIDQLTKGFQKRIFIKGRPGTGKSTLLKKILSYAQNLGYDTEIYYCSLDTQSLDMVIVRELGIAVFDSTSPHEKFPACDGDEVVDMYELCVNSGTDEAYADELMHISSRYNSEIKKAKECLYSISLMQQKQDRLIEENVGDVSLLIDRVISFMSLPQIGI